MTKRFSETVQDVDVDHFTLEDVVGSGAFGVVHRARDIQNNGRKVAVKIQRCKEENESLVEGEYRVMKGFNSHPNLPVFYDVFKQSYDGKTDVWFVMEVSVRTINQYRAHSTK